jgi:hypothetical protein
MLFLIWSVDRRTNGWLASSSVNTVRVKQSARERHGRRPDGAQARATGHGVRQAFFLRDLDDEIDPFRILTVAEAVDGRLETVTRFSRHLAAVSSYSDGPPATRISSVDSSCYPPAPPYYNPTERR